MSTAEDHTDPKILRNAVSIFLANFHVRTGNELLWSKGHVELEGVEWKVLPSGSHALEKDIIYFEVDQAQNGNGRIGVAVFVNKKLNQDERRSARGEGDDDDQRGARMISVGAILDCGKLRTPWSQLAATLPHLLHLEKLANAISEDPSCHNLMEEWFEMHKLGSEEMTMSAGRDVASHASLYAHDPLFQLPAISNALGPLLPSLLKRILLPSYRLLIYVPGGFPTHRAAAVAFNLGELAFAACQSQQEGGQCPVTGANEEQHGLVIRGLVGLHDIIKLQEEVEEVESYGKLQASWIAWTADKILLEKCQLYDAVLDLSPMTTSANSDKSDFLMTPTALPRLLCSQQIQSDHGKVKFELKKQTWTTREFAVFRGLDEQASHNAISRRGKRRSSIGLRTSQITLQDPTASSQRSQLERSPSKCLNQQRTTSTFLAFLRFWLSNIGILPYQWRINLRNSYGYVPLSIRGDGGVRASMMLLPDDDEEEDGQDGDGDYDESDEEDLEGGASSQHLSIPTDSPRANRRSSEEAVELSPEEDEDDPILAACGAGQASMRRRRRSRSLSKSGASHVADIVSHQIDSVGRPISPVGIVKVSPARNISQGQEDEMAEEARESVRLSLSIFETWSLWIKDLVMGVQDLIEEKMMKEQRLVLSGGEGEEEEGDNLLQGQNKVVRLSSQEISDLSMSISNQVDRDLILYLASTVTDRKVEFRRSWWSLANCLWS